MPRIRKASNRLGFSKVYIRIPSEMTLWRGFGGVFAPGRSRLSRSCSISDTRQAVTFFDNFSGFGYLPDLTPRHHVLLETGNIPNICFIL